MLSTDREIFATPIKVTTKNAKTNQLKLMVKDTKMILRKSQKDAIKVMEDSPNFLHYFSIELPPIHHPHDLPPLEPPDV